MAPSWLALLSYLTRGHHELFIDGRTASRGAKTYVVFEAGIVIKESETNVLPYTIWMPKIDTAHTVTIPSPTTSEVVVTTPHIPGLEVHIPANTVIYDEDKNTVTQLSITPIPVDRPPFPLPAGVYVPIYFTIQPGSGYVKTLAAWGPKGARIIYPNYRDQNPGTRHNFWHYDPEEKGWYVYGQGAVTEDGKQVVPDPGVAVYEFTGAMISPFGNPPADWPPPGSCSVDGDPVDLSTGLFVLNNTDLSLPDVLPLALTRTYRPKDTATRPFGIGSTHPYEMFLWSVTNYTQADLILPDGGRIHYVRISAGTGYSNAEYEHTATPTAFYKSRLKWNGTGWDVTLKDGTVYVFGDTTPLQSIRDRYGNKILITRAGGQSGNITRISSPNGRWMEFSYDGSNRITQARDLIGRAVNYTYDASGRLWKVTDPMGGVTEYTYDSSHRMLTIKNPRGIVYVTNEYDANGRISRQTHADGGVYQFAYTLDGNGKVTQTDVTDPRGTHRIVTFNASGYALTDSHAVGGSDQQTTTYVRQAGTNKFLSETDALGRRTDFTYDSLGNNTSVTELAGTADAVTVSANFDAVFSKPSSLTDPLGRTTSFLRDGKGNLISVTGPLRNQTVRAYNGAGQVVSISDPLNNTRLFAHDGGDIVRLTDQLGRCTTRFVDAGGRLVSETGPTGQTVRYEYDLLNRLSRMTDAQGGSTNLVYDANSNLITVTDPRGKTNSYSYDSMDRLISHTDPMLRTESFTYDQKGNVHSFTDRRGKVTSYGYDNLDRLIFVGYATITNGGTTTYERTATYGYDGASCGCGGANRLMQVVDSVSGTIAYTYDNLDRLVSETTSQGTVSYSYDAVGRRTTMSVTGQESVYYGYDNGGRLTQITKGTSTVAFSYDPADRITSMTLPNGVVTEFGYDAGSQLTSLIYRKGATALGSLSYEYDATGQIAKMGGTLAHANLSQSLGSASYDSANEMLTFGTQGLTYDANGNLTGNGVSTYTWDARNQLVSISGPGLTASFLYDAFGRRVSKTINGVTTSFLYDGASIVQEQLGGVASANLLAGGVDEVFVREESSNSWSLLLDALGSVVAMTDAAGEIRTQYTYEPFGATTSVGENNNNTLQYTQRENDGTGLYYYRARYYSPILQRFISEDPIGLNGGINQYTYAQNNPIRFSDPFGMQVYDCTRKLGGKPGDPPPFIPMTPTTSFPLHHEYLCVKKGNGEPTCRGLNQLPGGPLGSEALESTTKVMSTTRRVATKYLQTTAS